MPNPINDHNHQFRAIIPHLPPGAIAEFGVFNGGSTEQLTHFNRLVYAFDTFEGMPAEGYDQALDHENVPGKFAPQPNTEDWLRTLGVVIVRGRFADTLPNHTPAEPLAFAYVDCDWYSSHMECLHYIRRHMVSGGKILFDDYPGLAGCKKAVDEVFGPGRVDNGVVTL